MIRSVITLVVFLYALSAPAQSSFFEHAKEPNNGRIIGTSSAVVGLWSGSLIGLHQIWYSESWGDNFHTFNDSKQWMQMDKAGHFFTGQLLAEQCSNSYRWSGVNRNTSRILGSGISFAYLTSFELMDGRADEWGFSWSDVAANALGSAWYLSQDLLWNEQRIKLKFSAHMSPYAKYRPQVLGSTTAERLLKDYNGQTYWLSIAPYAFLNETSRFPEWLSFAFGYSVDQKLVGDEDVYVYTDANGTQVFSARRQYLISLDIDLSKLPVNKSWLKLVLNTLNHIKIPLPTLSISKGATEFHPIYF